MSEPSSEMADEVTTEQDRVSSTERDRVSTSRFGGVQTGERCTNCEAPLASDQRYCVNCGERRGKSRFSADSFAAPEPAPLAPAPKRRPRGSSGATLLAGVATLLVAMGVGVLIGHNGNNSTPRTVAASAPEIVNVGGGGGSSAGTTSNSKGRKSKTKKARVAHITKKVAAKAAAAASKVLGGSKPLAAPTVQPGQSCTNGQAGCQNGKFTGNFFGP